MALLGQPVPHLTICFWRAIPPGGWFKVIDRGEDVVWYAHPTAMAQLAARVPTARIENPDTRLIAPPLLGHFAGAPMLDLDAASEPGDRCSNLKALWIARMAAIKP